MIHLHLFLIVLLIFIESSFSIPFDIVHITDVHIDPHYSQGTIANGCYCESYANCPLARSPSCVYTDDPTKAALPFGMPEDECATSPALWESAMEYLYLSNQEHPASFVVFTGDFGEAGLSSPCTVNQTAQEAIVDNIINAVTAVRAAHPSLPLFGSFGNHDSSPGDVWDSTSAMSWLLKPSLDFFGKDFSTDTAALATLLKGGYYTTNSPLSGLRIISLNTNYWASTNPLLTNTSSEAYLLGQEQFSWLNETLAIATIVGEKVIIIGHHPPSAWISGTEYIYRTILTLYPLTVTVQLVGHNHVDQFSIIRACIPPPTPPSPSPNSTIQWIETDGIEWCSGSNWICGDVFHMGCSNNDCWCPLVPDFNGNITRRIEACETVCGNEPTCRGFTWYPDDGKYGACCMRTNTDQKPLNATSDVKCFEKPNPPSLCSGGPESPLHMLFVGPSLTEGYPPTNPAIRRVRIDSNTFQILDILTQYGNITQGNIDWAFLWQNEYTFMNAYSTLQDMSANSFNQLVEAMNETNSDEWIKYYQYNYKMYTGPSSLPCTGPCKSAEIAFLNGSKQGQG
jgi:hypothetical protein